MKPYEKWYLLHINWLAGFLPSTASYLSSWWLKHQYEKKIAWSNWIVIARLVGFNPFWKICASQIGSFPQIQQLKSIWHSPYILVYKDPLLTYLLVSVPSIFTLRYKGEDKKYLKAPASVDCGEHTNKTLCETSPPFAWFLQKLTPKFQLKTSLSSSYREVMKYDTRTQTSYTNFCRKKIHPKFTHIHCCLFDSSEKWLHSW